MNELNIPILKKTYDVCKTLHEIRRLVPKTERFTTFERSTNLTLDIIEGIFLASSKQKPERLLILEAASTKLNLLRLLVRLMKDMKTIDTKTYITLESPIDEIGRMLGGWIKSTK